MVTQKINEQDFNDLPEQINPKKPLVTHPKMICLLCRKRIEGDDNFVVLTEYTEGIKLSRGYYHRDCFRDKFISMDKQKKQADNIMSQASSMFGKMGL